MAGGVDAIVEQTLIDDAKLAVKFVRKEVGNEAKLVLYGHSMGTGIASRFPIVKLWLVEHKSNDM